MDSSTFVIPAGFLLVALIVGVGMVRASWPFLAKLVFVSVVPMFGIAVWYVIGSYQGWPVPRAPTGSFIVIGVAVEEPKGDVPGEVSFWGFPMDKAEVEYQDGFLSYRAAGNKPRAYVIPYSKLAHRVADTVQAMQQKGRVPVVDFKALMEGKGRSGSLENALGQTKRHGKLIPTGGDVPVYEMPPVVLNPKTL